MHINKKLIWTNFLKTCGDKSPKASLNTYLISISFFFLCSGTILSQETVKRPSLSSAALTFTSSAIENDLAKCLWDIPLWIISPLTWLSSDLLICLVLTVNKSDHNDADGEIIHKGISQRQFARSFTIADDVKVNGAELKDGLLTVSCERIVPEHKKKKLIEIK